LPLCRETLRQCLSGKCAVSAAWLRCKSVQTLHLMCQNRPRRLSRFRANPADSGSAAWRGCALFLRNRGAAAAKKFSTRSSAR
jgi:hypothetical protein